MQLKEIKREVDPALIQYLERALESVKAGETTGVMLIERKMKHVSWSHCGLGDRFELVGYLSHAIHEMHKD